MADIAASIKTAHEKNVGIMGTIEALKEVTTFHYFYKCSVSESVEKTFSGQSLSLDIPEEKRVGDVASFLSTWKFPRVLQDDFSACLETLNWRPSSWEEVQVLNEEIKRVALNLADFAMDENGKMAKKHKAELAKYLENLETIQKVLYALEDQLVGGESRHVRIKEEVAKHLKALNECLHEHGMQPDLPFKSSTVLSAAQNGLLASWYPGEWDIIFRVTRDGMSPAAFHSKADGKGPTVTVIQCEGNVFGGYTKVPWASGNSQGKPAHTRNVLPERFPINTFYSDRAVVHDRELGGNFGQDIKVFYMGPNCYCKFGQYFEDQTGNGKAALGDGRVFPITEIEVFALRPEVKKPNSSSSSSSSAA
uniref:TLDc domain-containing protein n=1 Tax=Chromera velia CCMP2878 TaxID=1169474 RepID=A0A0G4I2F7_9ALVE|eukprot:Cvel_10397.t1-p1 / transcript=Cvel_10397.t1 / gene=Cvel_10397 / organism=Chromera_velia_CCMP2878 / gene_product=hypothetical protein / transcript_product=hypothetical protein / location=Cvel_scaffold626:72500-73631(-) / protein_length=363 / sequence_SO=supercontig / SO=protein_coding / is_pseudo=false